MAAVIAPLRRVAGLGIAAVLAACEPAVPKDEHGLLAGVEVSLLEAMAVAEDELPDGVTVDAELSDEGEQRPQYDIDRYLHVDDETRELVIDARTGDVLKRLTDPEDQEEGPVQAAAIEASSHGITLTRAVEIAADAAEGTPVSAELALDAAEPSIYVVLLQDEERVLVIVDLDEGDVERILEAPADD